MQKLTLMQTLCMVSSYMEQYKYWTKTENGIKAVSAHLNGQIKGACAENVKTGEGVQWHSINNVSCEFVDYYTLRVGGLIFAGVVGFLSLILLAGKSTETPLNICVFVCLGFIWREMRGNTNKDADKQSSRGGVICVWMWDASVHSWPCEN